jgi:hypothetical protein
MNGLTVDRSGRTLEDYRELYWKFKARVKELEAQIATFSQLADEMQESECGPFPDSAKSEGWSAARSFYAKELRALLNQESGVCGHGSG